MQSAMILSVFITDMYILFYKVMMMNSFKILYIVRAAAIVGKWQYTARICFTIYSFFQFHCFNKFCFILLPDVTFWLCHAYHNVQYFHMKIVFCIQHFVLF